MLVNKRLNISRSVCHAVIPAKARRGDRGFFIFSTAGVEIECAIIEHLFVNRSFNQNIEVTPGQSFRRG
ncbi:hypothetical protein SedNR2807_01850 [Citrobacter sedlakii]